MVHLIPRPRLATLPQPNQWKQPIFWIWQVKTDLAPNFSLERILFWYCKQTYSIKTFQHITKCKVHWLISRCGYFRDRQFNFQSYLWNDFKTLDTTEIGLQILEIIYEKGNNPVSELKDGKHHWYIRQMVLAKTLFYVSTIPKLIHHWKYEQLSKLQNI